MTEEGTITIKKDDLWKYSMLALVAVLVIGSFFVFTGNGVTPSGNVVNDGGNNQPIVVEASVDDDAILGDEDAPVTIIEFSDYQCPLCERFWSETLPLIREQYIDTGKVRFVYRDFPLSSTHPMAQPAAEVSECVRDQGGDDAFWEMHDMIFANQQDLSIDNLETWAQDMEYDISSCLSSGEFRSEVLKDTADAQSAGARGTPYFVIEGKALSGACPFSSFSLAIEAELEGKEWYSPGNCQVEVI